MPTPTIWLEFLILSREFSQTTTKWSMQAHTFICIIPTKSHSFIKPLRAILELSGFPMLTWLYKILVTLAISSSSAERAMSRVRIIKNRLRTTMLDDWFSSLMIISSEKDIVERLHADAIIDSFAATSPPLRKLLLRNWESEWLSWLNKFNLTSMPILHFDNGSMAC